MRQRAAVTPEDELGPTPANHVKRHVYCSGRRLRERFAMTPDRQLPDLRLGTNVGVVVRCSRVRADPTVAGPPVLSLFYGPSRYGTMTSQKMLKPLRRSGCGPLRPDTVSEMKSLKSTGLAGSPVYP